MARPTESAIADVVMHALGAFDAGARVLVAGDATGQLATTLAQTRGTPVATWQRRAAPGASGGGSARAWPPVGPFDGAIVRLPKARAELEMTLHAVAAVTAPGAIVWLYGANDEGIKSAATTMERLLGPVATVDTRRHCRIVAAARPQTIEGHKSLLAAWRSTVMLDVGSGARDFATYPGVFAHGRIDEGTTQLLAHLPVVLDGKRVLDFGCGIGIIAAAVGTRSATATLTMLDADTVALEAARENLPAATAVCGASLSDAARHGPFDAIFSNPPIHDGRLEDHTVLAALIEQAPHHLRRGGILQIVVQRRVPATAMIRRAFGACEVVAQRGAFEVLRARHGGPRVNQDARRAES